MADQSALPSYAAALRDRLFRVFLTDPARLQTRNWDRIAGFPTDGPPDAKADFALQRILNAYPHYHLHTHYKILHWVLNGFMAEDFSKLASTLSLYDRVKNKLPKTQRDLGAFKTYADLMNAVAPYEDIIFVAPERLAQLRATISTDDAETIWESPQACLIHLKTKSGAIAYGAGTKWCTAFTEAENYFKDYKEDLLVLWLANGRRIQIHFDSNSINSEQDQSCKDFDKILKSTPGLAEKLAGFMVRSFKRVQIPDFHCAEPDIVSVVVNRAGMKDDPDTIECAIEILRTISIDSQLQPHYKNISADFQKMIFRVLQSNNIKLFSKIQKSIESIYINRQWKDSIINRPLLMKCWDYFLDQPQDKNSNPILPLSFSCPSMGEVLLQMTSDFAHRDLMGEITPRIIKKLIAQSSHDEAFEFIRHVVADSVWALEIKSLPNPPRGHLMRLLVNTGLTNFLWQTTTGIFGPQDRYEARQDSFASRLDLYHSSLAPEYAAVFISVARINGFAKKIPPASVAAMMRQAEKLNRTVSADEKLDLVRVWTDIVTPQPEWREPTLAAVSAPLRKRLLKATQPALS